LAKFEHRDNSGTLFKNDRRTSDKHPEYKGEGVVNGVPVWISAWVKEGAKGKFFSMAFQPKDEQKQQPQKSSYQPEAAGDDVPF
jgi:hypothetical protein